MLRDGADAKFLADESEVVGVLPHFPIRDEVGEALELVALVGDEGGHEFRAQNLGEVGVLLQRVDGLTEAAGQHVRLGGVVAVADQLGRRLEPVADPQVCPGQQAGDGQVRVR